MQPFGAFVEIIPGIDGLLHISEIDWKRLDNVEEVLHVGDEVEVKLVEIDDKGKMRLSRKVLLPKPEGYEERPERPRRPNGGNGKGPRHSDHPRHGHGKREE